MQSRRWILRWKAGHNDPKAPVLIYTVWYRVLEITNGTIRRRLSWKSVNVTKTERAMELEDHEWYEFHVTAWNKWGASTSNTNNTKIIEVDFGEGPTFRKSTAPDIEPSGGYAISKHELLPANI